MADSPDPGRSLREVFESLAGDPGADPAAALAASGHGDLPSHLLTEAIVSYADTAPPEVGEHLAPVILGTAGDPAEGLELLASAPAVTWDDVPDDEFDVGDETEPLVAADDVPDHLPDLDFGAGDDAPDHLADDAADTGDDATDDVAADDAPAHHVPAVALEADDVPEPVDDLPHHDLAGEGWDDAAWDGDDHHDAPDDDFLDS